MAEIRSSLTRRAAVVSAYAIVSGLLLEVVATDLPWVESTLADVGAIVPETIHLVDDPATFAIVGLAVLAGLLAAGTFLVSPRTGTGFGLFAAASLAWTLFPYARIPWSTALDAPTNQTPAVPAGAWVLAGLVTLLATIEIAINARTQLLDHVDRLGLDTSEAGLADVTRAAQTRWLATSVLVGAGATIGYTATRPLAQGLLDDPNLLLVPALAGLVAGAALWLWARE